MPTATVEDYLKQLYLLELETPATTIAMGRLAEAVGVVPGTATVMIKKLAAAEHVQYEPYVGVRLTAGGERIALGVLRRHRLVEALLVEVLGLDWSEVHDEAEILEHVISDKLLNAIDRTLGFPTVDPHGDPIPTAEGSTSHNNLTTLLDAPIDQPLEVQRVCSQDESFLRYVAEQGLRPGARVLVAARDAGGETLALRLEGNQDCVVAFSAAAKLQVRAG